uniref:NAD(P)/FAD-dependent oxidoreductase n=1 Tax=Roseihalotalea indica TaxID=2867963 RepID=A0AA49JHD0_9BACT|nr:NAD(P)/FAD-dependent oxidoreductase [Tunicatimonas sp. TK19036]
MIHDKTDFEVLIVGGSYAGLAAAMALGRSLRKVLIIDSGKPCNQQTPHAHNFLTQDGVAPGAIAAQAKEQVLQYETVEYINGLVTSVNKKLNQFEVSTGEGQTFSASKILFATGVKDLMPPIKGFAECWGISVLHCPYCHGYEVRNENLGILANGEAAFEMGKLIQHWAGALTLFTNGKPTLSAEQIDFIEQMNIKIIDTEIEELVHDSGYLKHVLLQDGTTVDLTAMFSKIDFEQHCKIPLDLGCAMTEHGHLEVDTFQKTSVDGIFAAGDNATPMRALSLAISSGTKVGAFINVELIKEQLAQVG